MVNVSFNYFLNDFANILREASATDRATLSAAVVAVRGPGFNAQWGYIVSWVGVPAYPGQGSVSGFI